MKMKKTVLIKLLCIVLALLVFGYRSLQENTADVQTVPQAETSGQLSILPESQTTPPSEETAQPAETETPAETPQAAGEPSTAPEDGDTQQPAVAEDAACSSRDEVALYLHTYGHLPPNFVTKAEARDAGWEGGSLEKYFPGCSIGGDVFGNREGLLPDKKGRTYYECDIDTAGKSARGAKRIVFSDDGLIYYTDDHYESFTLLYGED